MIRLLSLVAFLIAVPVFGKDDFRLQVVSGTDPGQKIAQELVNRAQECWEQQNRTWFGAENVSLPNPCTVRVNLLPTKPGYTRGGGMTEFKRQIPGGYVLKDSLMTVTGDRQRLLDNTIPHEVHHLVMAYHLGKDNVIPRWIDEGLASLCESDSYQKVLEKNLLQHLREGRTPRANIVFTSPEYPADVMPFYTASVSWCRYLMQRGGFPRVIELIEGVQDGRSYTSLFKEIYGWDSIQEAQDDWLAWVGDGFPKNTYTASQYAYDCYGRPLSCTTGDCYSQPMMVQPAPVQPQPMPSPSPPVVVRPTPRPAEPDQEPQTNLEPVKPQRGEKGEKGDRGERGERGEKGDKGDAGDAGDRGEKGDDGRGVDKMFLDNKGNIHVAYTDGSDHTIGNVYDLRPEEDTTARQGETGSPRPAYFDIVPKGSN